MMSMKELEDRDVMEFGSVERLVVFEVGCRLDDDAF